MEKMKGKWKKMEKWKRNGRKWKRNGTKMEKNGNAKIKMEEKWNKNGREMEENGNVCVTPTLSPYRCHFWRKSNNSERILKDYEMFCQLDE